MIDLDTIWKDMEAAIPPTQSGRFRRRILPASSYDLFITLEKPSNHRSMLFEVAAISVADQSDIPSTQAVISRIDRNIQQDKAIVELELIDPRYSDIFSTLVSDLLNVIVSTRTQQEAFREFLSRLQQWILFLEHFGPDGLSPEAQRGLYGELWFLKNYLLNRLDHQNAIAAWVGPAAAHQDFQLPGSAVEVKVTTAKLPQNIMISNERQLDDSSVETLLLLHLLLDARKGGGETLNKIIEIIRTLLSPSNAILQTFEQSLLKVGYLDKHQNRYNDLGYTVLSNKFFHVRQGFPRIISADLIVGVGNIHYSIELSACYPFTTSTEFVLSVISKGS
jgi:hypothetical protein